MPGSSSSRTTSRRDCSPLTQSSHANYERVDGLLYPIEAIAGLRSYDVVRLARISPRDAQLGLARKDVSEKVTGTRYGHFAAFFKRSWRSNDILWGRLDGACELVDVLLEDDRLEKLFGHAAPDPALLAALAKTIPDIEADPNALPLPPKDRARLFLWLGRLISTDLGERRTALAEFTASRKKPGREVDGPLHWLVLGAQLEGLKTGLADVYSDHHAERYEQENPGAGSLADDKVRQLTRASLASVGATPAKLIEFFRKDYGVGSEELDKLPAFVVVDWVARGLVLMRNSLLVSAGDRAAGIRSHILFQLLFGWPLRALVALSGLLRRAPHWLAAFTLGSVAYIVLSTVVLVLFYENLKLSPHKWITQGLFIAFPVLLLSFLWLIARVRGPGGGVSKVLRIVAGCIGGAFLLSLIPVFDSVRTINPKASCGVLPERLVSTCYRMWTSELTALAPSLVLGAACLGVLSFFGFFGWLGRKLAKLDGNAMQ